MTREPISLPAIPVSQPLGEYYIAAISRQDLLAISYVDRRELKSGKKTDYDSYTGRKWHIGTTHKLLQRVALTNFAVAVPQTIFFL
jgi:hypothetical protein